MRTTIIAFTALLMLTPAAAHAEPEPLHFDPYIADRAMDHDREERRDLQEKLDRRHDEAERDIWRSEENADHESEADLDQPYKRWAR